MVRMNSNKERIQRKAAEAAVAKKEKTEKTEKKKTTPRKKTVAPATRQKIVWKVFDSYFREVVCFPYVEKTKAYATAETLTRKKNVNHFVNEVNVAMEEV